MSENGNERKRHILITGEVGAGKSTLIKRLLSTYTGEVYGFITKKLEADANGFHPIYIHRAGENARVYTEENLIGTCDRRIHNVNLAVFDTLGAEYLRAKEGGLIVMDELGFMESEAHAFTSAVLEALAGDIPVIAAVKARYDVAFLDAVRASKKVELFTVTRENREALYRELLPRFVDNTARG